MIDHYKKNFSKHDLQHKETLALVPGLFVFHNLVYKKGLGAKEKIKLTFQRFLDNPFSKYLIFKRVSYMYWLFKKINKGSGTSF